MEKLSTQIAKCSKIPKVNIQQFLEDTTKAKKFLIHNIDDVDSLEIIECLLGLPEKVFKEIHRKCGPHVFANYHEKKFDEPKLECLKYQEEMDKNKKKNYYKSMLNVFNYKDVELIDYLKTIKFPIEMTIKRPEVIVTLTFYIPNQIYTDQKICPSTMIVNIDQRFECLGSNTLAELRDKIFCDCDYGVYEDISENPTKPVSFFSKDIFKSGFFLIENVFYNDTRSTNNVDYSAPIIPWGESHGLGPYQTKIMENTQIKDLEICIGKPYMFFHQGDCQHLFIISDIRLAGRDDLQNGSLYPVRIFTSTEKIKYCYVCNSNIARYITFEDSHVPDDPSLFCQECFMFLHYDTNGQKLGTFRAYPYTDRNNTFHTRRFSTYLNN